MAVLRIGVDDGLIAGDGGGPVAASGVEGGDVGLARGQDLLHLAQPLLGLRDQGGIGELLQHQAVLFLGVRGLGVVAVGLVHLAEVDVADAHLGLGGLGRVGEEGDEVLVLLLGLGEGGGAAFLVPAIGDGELGLHHDTANRDRC